MKKMFFCVALIAMVTFSAYDQRNADRLVVWSFSDEIENMMTMHNVETTLGMRIDYSLTPTDQFSDRLTPALRAGRWMAPDVFALEAAFVRMYIESGLLLDLTDLYNGVRGKILRYTVEVATHNGRVYGMSWQATPGAMFFRRSLARQYLGTDDPVAVQAYFSNWDRFFETARRIGGASNGRTVAVSSMGDLFHPFRGARTQPWVVNGRLHIDPAMIQYMRTARYLRQNGLEGRVEQWSEGWFDGMRGNLSDARGRLNVFAYFLPTWGLHFVLAQNAPGTSGDWAMIPGPAPWFWGGTWLAAYRGTRHPEAARNFIRLLTTNETNLERWALGTGDLLSHTVVVDRIKDGFSMPFLGGQNHYAAFAEMAMHIYGRLIQGTDEAINTLFMGAITQYANGEATMEQALAWFREQIRDQLGIN